MKVAFTGPSGAGKTTLAKRLSYIYKVKLISNVASERAHLSPEMQTLYVTSRFMEVLSSGEDFISDRWFLDNLVYARMQGFPQCYTQTLRYLLDLSFRQGVKIFYVPYPFDSLSDQFTQLLARELEDYNQVIPVRGLSIEERLDFVQKVLRS